MQDARRFNCARCHIQVFICRRCDRGNIYCPTCAVLARKESLGRAGSKYQSTVKGKANHAARQQEYLIRKEQKASTAPLPCPSITKATPQTIDNLRLEVNPEYRCALDSNPLNMKPQTTKMTHQGSDSTLIATKLVTQTMTVQLHSQNTQEEPDAQLHAMYHSPSIQTDADAVVCHFCGTCCSPFLRLDFLYTPHKGEKIILGKKFVYHR